MTPPLCSTLLWHLCWSGWCCVVRSRDFSVRIVDLRLLTFDEKNGRRDGACYSVAGDTLVTTGVFCHQTGDRQVTADDRRTAVRRQLAVHLQQKSTSGEAKNVNWRHRFLFELPSPFFTLPPFFSSLPIFFSLSLSVLHLLKVGFLNCS